MGFGSVYELLEAEQRPQRLLSASSSKGEIKRRNADQERRFLRLKELRAGINWAAGIDRRLMDHYEDLAADCDDSEAAAALLHCLEVMKATVRERDAAIRMMRNGERQITTLSTF